MSEFSLIQGDVVNKLKVDHLSRVTEAEKAFADGVAELARLKEERTEKRKKLTFWKAYDEEGAMEDQSYLGHHQHFFHWDDENFARIKRHVLAGHFQKFLEHKQEDLKAYYAVQEKIDELEFNLYHKEPKMLDLEYEDMHFGEFYLEESLEHRKNRLREEYEKALPYYFEAMADETAISDSIESDRASIEQAKASYQTLVDTYVALQKNVVAAHTALAPGNIANLSPEEVEALRDSYATALNELVECQARLSGVGIEETYQKYLQNQIVTWREYSADEDAKRAELSRLETKVKEALTVLNRLNNRYRGYYANHMFLTNLRGGNVPKRRKEIEKIKIKLDVARDQRDTQKAEVIRLQAQLDTVKQKYADVTESNVRLSTLHEQFTWNLDKTLRFQVIGDVYDSFTSLDTAIKTEEHNVILAEEEVTQKKATYSAAQQTENNVRTQWETKIEAAQQKLAQLNSGLEPGVHDPAQQQTLIADANADLQTATEGRDSAVAEQVALVQLAKNALAQAQQALATVREGLEVIKATLPHQIELVKVLVASEREILSQTAREKIEQLRKIAVAQINLLPALLWDVYRKYPHIVKAMEEGGEHIVIRKWAVVEQKREEEKQARLDYEQTATDVKAFQEAHKQHNITTQDISVLDMYADRYDDIAEDFDVVIQQLKDLETRAGIEVVEDVEETEETEEAEETEETETSS